MSATEELLEKLRTLKYDYDSMSTSLEDAIDDIAYELEQAIAATLVSPVNTFTLDEIEDLYKDLCDSDGGTLAAIVDGVCYETDWGYGVDAVRHFIDMLRRRHRIEVDA